MGAGHTHALYVHEHSVLHRLPPECKVAAAMLLVVAVVATPREALWAFAAHAVLLGSLTQLGRIPPLFVLRRLVLETPFLLFAAALPFLVGGERIDVLGVALSAEGLWGAWNIVAKATLGFSATIMLAATTDLPELLRGLDRLRVPRAFTAVAGFMVRYVHVVGSEAQRMNVARRSRGHDPRWLWQARGVGHAIGALFVRAYERGERVHLAMLSRGYAGAMPDMGGAAATSAQWAAALTAPAVAAAVALAAWLAWPAGPA